MCTKAQLFYYYYYYYEDMCSDEMVVDCDDLDSLKLTSMPLINEIF